MTSDGIILAVYYTLNRVMPSEITRWQDKCSKNTKLLASPLSLEVYSFLYFSHISVVVTPSANCSTLISLEPSCHILFRNVFSALNCGLVELTLDLQINLISAKTHALQFGKRMRKLALTSPFLSD